MILPIMCPAISVHQITIDLTYCGVNGCTGRVVPGTDWCEQHRDELRR